MLFIPNYYNLKSVSFIIIFVLLIIINLLNLLKTLNFKQLCLNNIFSKNKYIKLINQINI